MTTDDDFKRLVRARISRTGESYSTARANLLGRRRDRGAGTPSVTSADDLTALIHRASSSFRTARGEARWSYNGGIGEALRRANGEAPKGPEEWMDWEPWVETFSVRPPYNLRLDRQGGKTDRLPKLRVLNDREWWAAGTDLAGEDVLVLHGSPEAFPQSWRGFVPDLLDPVAVLEIFDLLAEGSALVAGRPALQLRARPRSTLRSHRPMRGVAWIAAPAATSYRLWVDSEFGVLLRSVSLLEDEPISVLEIDRVDFDVPLAEALFTFLPPESARVEDIDSPQFGEARSRWESSWRPSS